MARIEIRPEEEGRIVVKIPYDPHRNDDNGMVCRRASKVLA